MRKLFFIFVILVLALAAGAFWWFKWHSAPLQYRTAVIRKGTLQVTVNATGTVEPSEVVDVGAQVNGLIQSFGDDPNHPGQQIDYNSKVTKGEVLARIDDSLYAAAVESDKAALAQAQANLVAGKANLQLKQAALDDAAADWNRAQSIGENSGALAATQYDQYKSTYEQAIADVAVAQANILQEQAAIQQAQATLDHDQINLNYCTIISPVNGVIIDRRVDIGETVVSSLSTPSLFLISTDLTNLQVWASVDEADIGKIHDGQKVSFTLDALPNQTFTGTVEQIRLNASLSQNVVTYTVVVDTKNPNGVILPYLTADLDFIVAQHKNVLMAPIEALEFQPTSESQVDPQFRSLNLPPPLNVTTVATRPAATQASETSESSGSQGVLWVVEGNYLKPIIVQTGLDNDSYVEVSGDGVEPGMQVVIAEAGGSGGGTAGSTNPFLPQFHH
ncbi:MAG TPA: efflux RND transporter periplasmic adaptor subunit [Phycisphaerae bacterium]|nr:efflux RND transporter periplasmic adaptor subunit [Phycisphaerae bacterium]